MIRRKAGIARQLRWLQLPLEILVATKLSYAIFVLPPSPRLKLEKELIKRIQINGCRIISDPRDLGLLQARKLHSYAR